MGGMVQMFTGWFHDRPVSWGAEETVDSKAALLDDEDGNGHSRVSLRRGQQGKRGWLVLTICNALLFTGAILMYAITWMKFSGRNYCLKATSAYTPVLDEIDMPLTDTLLNGSLWLGDHPSPWRGAPGTDETETAWGSFEPVRPIALTKAQVLAMGKDPEMVSKFNDDYWHLGDDAYVGALDIFHQAHCLDALRQEAFGDWGRAGEKRPSWDDIHWLHLRHCTDMLMQNLLCHADAGFLTYNWLEHANYPFPDMSVHKQCRDWRQLEKYRDEHGVNLTKYIEWKKPDGVLELKEIEEAWQHRGQHDNPHPHD